MAEQELKTKIAKRQIGRYKQLYNATKKKLDKQTREIARLEEQISSLEAYIDAIGSNTHGIHREINER